MKGGQALSRMGCLQIELIGNNWNEGAQAT